MSMGLPGPQLALLKAARASGNSRLVVVPTPMKKPLVVQPFDKETPALVAHCTSIRNKDSYAGAGAGEWGRSRWR